eukprot:6408110-Pyramimonas_sp.AAC.1
MFSSRRLQGCSTGFLKEPKKNFNWAEEGSSRVPRPRQASNLLSNSPTMAPASPMTSPRGLPERAKRVPYPKDRRQNMHPIKITPTSEAV